MDIEITRMDRFREPEGRKLGEFDARLGFAYIRRGLVLLNESTGRPYATLPQRGGYGGRGIYINRGPESAALIEAVMQAWHEAG